MSLSCSFNAVGAIGVLPAPGAGGGGRRRPREVPGARVGPSHASAPLQPVEVEQVSWGHLKHW